MYDRVKPIFRCSLEPSLDPSLFRADELSPLVRNPSWSIVAYTSGFFVISKNATLFFATKRSSASINLESSSRKRSASSTNLSTVYNSKTLECTRPNRPYTSWVSLENFAGKSERLIKCQLSSCSPGFAIASVNGIFGFGFTITRFCKPVRVSWQEPDSIFVLWTSQQYAPSRPSDYRLNCSCSPGSFLPISDAFRKALLDLFHLRLVLKSGKRLGRIKIRNGILMHFQFSAELGSVPFRCAWSPRWGLSIHSSVWQTQKLLDKLKQLPDVRWNLAGYVRHICCKLYNRLFTLVRCADSPPTAPPNPNL